MYVRKMRKKWQCLVRLKGISISQSFFSKGEASRWGKEKEVEILNGTYLKDLKLTQMRLKDLLQLYLEKAGFHSWSFTGTVSASLGSSSEPLGTGTDPFFAIGYKGDGWYGSYDHYVIEDGDIGSFSVGYSHSF